MPVKRFQSWLWIVPLLLIVAALGARGLNADTLWGDEYHSISDAGGSPFEPLTPVQIWNGIADHNPWHTPGYFLVLNGWGRLVGWSAPALRALSLLFGLLALAWTYRLGRDLVSPTVGLLAALILGTSASFVYYLHEIRMYILFVALASFELWVYLRIMRARREPDKLAWLALFAGALSMLYIHYFAVLPLMAVGIYHLSLAVRRENGRLRLHCAPRWWKVVGVMVAAGILFIPWMSVLIDVTGKVTKKVNLRAGTLDLPETISVVLTMFGNGFLPLALAMMLPALWRPSRRVWRIIALLGLTFAFALIINLWLQVVYYDARARYLFALWPLLALVAAIGLARLGQMPRLRRLAPLLLGLWLMTGLWGAVDWAHLTHYLEGSDLDFPMNKVAEDLKGRAQPGDTVISYLPDDMPAWRYGGVSDYYYRGLGLDFRTVERRWDAGGQDAEQIEVIGSLVNDLRVWLAWKPTPPPYALDTFKTALSENFGICQAHDDPKAGISLALYTRAAVCCVPDGQAAPVKIDYGSGIALSGVEPLLSSVSDTLPVTLAWSLGPQVPLNTYSVGLHVLDLQGKLVAQKDYGLTVQPFLCQSQSVSLTDVPPGNYQLTLVVYAWETGQRLTGSVPGTNTRAEELPLGTFTIQR
jgi:hypothetical protein